MLGIADHRVRLESRRQVLSAEGARNFNALVLQTVF